MTSQHIKVKEASSSKLRMAQIQGWVTKGWGVEVEDAMMRFGWQRENGPGASRVEGSQWSVRGGLKEPVKVKGGHL